MFRRQLLSFHRPQICLPRAAQRCLATNPILANSVVEEAQDIASVDRLLKAVRKRADPAFHNVMPMRTAVLWSEALLNSALKNEAAEPSSPLIQQETTDELVPRNMHDSYSELVIPFALSPAVLEQYINASGGIRMGKLMENLDSLAGSIAYKHLLGPGVQELGRIQDRGFYIVTASVDRLDMYQQVDPSRDLRLSGQVMYTGKSSMEIAMKMESIGGDQPDQTAMIGRFSMVCRDARTHKARKVHPLIVTTDEERALYALGEHIKQRRKKAASTSLSQVPPSSEEASELHSFYLQHGQGAIIHSNQVSNRVWMGETSIDNCMLMFPQERNVHQKVFGGYLMRLAYELGFSNATIFCRGRVRFLSLDGISFARPVPIGSLLRLESMIIHTSSSAEHPVLVHVGVKANVVDVKTGSEQMTNDFRFTWYQDQEHMSSSIPRQVVPKTYQEAMLWLEGKRALELGAQIRRSL
ncbi:Thioesterase/thiol ester dehydrase-isomerase [Coprinopsis marcescibilis]|uniref:Thioesterase/thiol ester dehydrase-isomerase n=1 Tax=Coprinopsis marcescibilis TaxID=230819 RepID=A0A5C3KBS8_COPMA|nr:Thioesterase/thiol ester dehydrase-isomerase [Coprinopsis marcescibilis]